MRVIFYRPENLIFEMKSFTAEILPDLTGLQMMLACNLVSSQTCEVFTGVSRNFMPLLVLRVGLCIASPTETDPVCRLLVMANPQFNTQHQQRRERSSQVFPANA